MPRAFAPLTVAIFNISYASIFLSAYNFETRPVISISLKIDNLLLLAEESVPKQTLIFLSKSLDKFKKPEESFRLLAGLWTILTLFSFIISKSLSVRYIPWAAMVL